MVGNKNIKEIKEKIKNSEIKELKELDIKYLVEQEILDCFLRINASEDQIKKLIDCHNDIFDSKKVNYAEIIKPNWRKNNELLRINPKKITKTLVMYDFPFEFFYCYIFENTFKTNFVKNLEDYINETIKYYLDVIPNSRELKFLRRSRERLFYFDIRDKKFEEAKKEIIENYELEDRWACIPYYAFSKELKSDELIIEWAMYVDDNNFQYVPKEAKEDKEFMNKLRKAGYSV